MLAMIESIADGQHQRIGGVARPVVLLAGEESFVVLLKYILEHADFVCHDTKSSNAVTHLAEQHKPDLIALDSALGQGAEHAWRQLANNVSTRDIPVVVLISGVDDLKRLKMSDLQAADYLLTPFVPSRLIAAFRNILHSPQAGGRAGIISFGDIHMDLKAHRIFRNKREIHVGPIEFKLLQHLMNHPCQVFSRRELLERVWGREIHVIPRTIDVHMSRLRRALNEGNEANYIRTVRAVGYSLDA